MKKIIYANYAVPLSSEPYGTPPAETDKDRELRRLQIMKMSIGASLLAKHLTKTPDKKYPELDCPHCDSREWRDIHTHNGLIWMCWLCGIKYDTSDIKAMEMHACIK